MTEFNAYVEANEPGVLKFEMNRQMNVDSGKEDIVYIETSVLSHFDMVEDLLLIKRPLQIPRRGCHSGA
jgi:hypothetical protein